MNNTYDIIVAAISICLCLYYAVNSVLVIRDIVKKRRVMITKRSTMLGMAIASLVYTVFFFITIYVYGNSSEFN